MRGWRKYKKHVKQSSSQECDTGEEDKPENLVDNWFWHFFDILLVIKISLATVFIYSLNYRESNSYQ